MDSKRSNYEQSGYLEQCWSKIDHSIVLNSPEIECDKKWILGGSQLRLTRQLWLLWEDEWFWAFSRSWRCGKFLSRCQVLETPSALCMPAHEHIPPGISLATGSGTQFDHNNCRIYVLSLYHTLQQTWNALPCKHWRPNTTKVCLLQDQTKIHWWKWNFWSWSFSCHQNMSRNCQNGLWKIEMQLQAEEKVPGKKSVTLTKVRKLWLASIPQRSSLRSRQRREWETYCMDRCSPIKTSGPEQRSQYREARNHWWKALLTASKQQTVNIGTIFGGLHLFFFESIWHGQIFNPRFNLCVLYLERI